MIWKYASMSELVRMVVAVLGAVWLFNHDFARYGWLVVTIGVFPTFWDITGKAWDAEILACKVKAAQIEVEGRWLEAAIERFRKKASFERITSIAMCFFYPFGFLAYAAGMIGPGQFDVELSMAHAYWPGVTIALAMIVGLSVWIVVEERERRHAKRFLLLLEGCAK